MNKKRINYLANLLETMPPPDVGFNMKGWIVRNEDAYKRHNSKRTTECGTAACIAGWAVGLWGFNEERTPDVSKLSERLIRYHRSGEVDRWSMVRRARQILGLDENTARALFIPLQELQNNRARYGTSPRQER